MTLTSSDLPPFDSASFFDCLLTRAPALFSDAERSPLVRNLALARDEGRKLNEFYRRETAALWFELWTSIREVADVAVPNIAESIPVHRFVHEGYPFADKATANVKGFFSTRYSSAFEMFGLDEYAALFPVGAENRPTYMLLAPLAVVRPSVESLEAVPARIRRQVVTVLEPGFEVNAAVAWIEGSRFRPHAKSPNESHIDRLRFTALMRNGVPAEEAVSLVYRYPKLEVGTLVAGYANGIPVDYMEAM